MRRGQSHGLSQQHGGPIRNWPTSSQEKYSTKPNHANLLLKRQCIYDLLAFTKLSTCSLSLARIMILSIPLSLLHPLLSFFLLRKVHGSAPAFSPPASTELICHTARASDCYPAIFQPTEHFQRIHDDQSVPAGLHIRMNLATGLKEARLNVPELSGISHTELVVIDDLSPRPSIGEDDAVTEILELQDQSDPNTRCERRRPYHPAASNVEESSLFFSSISTLHSTTALSNTDLPALSTLQDLAYSIHWGVALARDTAVCQKLVSAIDPGSHASGGIRSAAALLLGTAIHSNPEALDAVLSHQYSSEASLTPAATVLAVLRAPDQGDLMIKTRTVFLLSQLCQHPGQLRVFVDSGGLDTLYDLFEPHRTTLDDGKDKFRAKAANFIYDRILPYHENGLAFQSRPKINILGNDQALMKDLEPWCNGFIKALSVYELVSSRAENLSAAADAAFESIKEANQALKEQTKICGNESEL